MYKKCSFVYVLRQAIILTFCVKRNSWSFEDEMSGIFQKDVTIMNGELSSRH